jgi:hypothetical protein
MKNEQTAVPMGIWLILIFVYMLILMLLLGDSIHSAWQYRVIGPIGIVYATPFDALEGRIFLFLLGTVAVIGGMMRYRLARWLMVAFLAIIMMSFLMKVYIGMWRWYP